MSVLVGYDWCPSKECLTDYYIRKAYERWEK
jgi:hypothetical protein